MSITSRILLFFVLLGGVNIIILLLIKSRAKSIKIKEESYKKGDITVLNYDDENLICLVDNDLEFKYGYECNDLTIFKNMRITHRNIYTLLWFDTEMQNGGLGEYLFSVSNITMGYLQKALEDVKAFELLASYKSFIENNNMEEVVNNISKRSVEEYSQFMSKFDFSNFNDLYVKNDLKTLIAQYIRSNITDFSDLSEKELEILREIEEEQKLISNN